MTNRAVKAQATREKLLRTADRLITQQGYENISVEDITRASGIAKGTFYNYFSKKADIIAAVGQTHFADLNQSIPVLVTQDSAQASLTQYLTTFMNIIATAGITRLRDWIRMIIVPSSSANKWDYDLAALTQLISALVDQHRLTRETPVSLLATTMTTQVYGIIFTWSLAESTRNPRHEIAEFCNQPLGQLLAPYLPVKK